MEVIKYPEHLVFGLDIGTRSIVGIVGYKENAEDFKVIAHVIKEHETRAMMDGQIHDIGKVSETIGNVKRELEKIIDRKLTDVCIAAAGRVLKTIVVNAELNFAEETKITDEHIYSLDLLGVEKAYDAIRNETQLQETNFYCVGYSIIKYYLNDYPISNLEGHKGTQISAQLIATFLPDEVIDGLYQAVERAGLYVSNLTLEPIAAINVAIPQRFRLLNIGLVDVGAGTSDICITKDGSVIAYGMIPSAGDELTELIAQKYLTDFQTAEKIKMACNTRKTVSYKDIMGISHKEETKNVVLEIKENICAITKSIADKIIELNGNKSVSAVFVVGGGGKIPLFTKTLAEYLGIPEERVALRGEEVLGNVEFFQEKVKKDSLLVTPIGICLNYYEQKNNFIFVNINGERVKLYDNDKLTIVDAALQIGIQKDLLFPRRGKPLNFTVDGKKRMVRGSLGEAAIVTLNGKPVGINHEIASNDRIEITYSTVGEDAVYEIRQLGENKGVITFLFNGKQIVCPKFLMANGELVSEFYSIQENDKIQVLNYYTLAQVLEFMDLERKGDFYVNHVKASFDEKIYDNFTITSEEAGKEHEYYPISFQQRGIPEEEFSGEKTLAEDEGDEEDFPSSQEVVITASEVIPKREMRITVNGEEIILTGKSRYIFVDAMDAIAFDTSKGANKRLVKMLNGADAEFTSRLHDTDAIQLYWEDENVSIF